MSWYTRLVSGCLFPVHERLKKHSTVAVRKQMEQNQWRSAEAIKAQQLQSLKAFLSDIGQSVPYYQKLFAELGFEPDGMTDIADLQRLPLTGKPEIRAHTEALKAQDAVGLARFNTGGSSGEPLIFYIGAKRVSHDVAAKWRATRWWGVDIGDPEIVVWGSPIELGAQDRVRQVRDKMLRTQLLPAFEMSAEKLDDFVATIQSVRPKMLFGYPSALAHIAEHAKTVFFAVQNIVHIALAPKPNVLGFVLSNWRVAHLFEKLFKLFWLIMGKFDKFEPIGAGWVFFRNLGWWCVVWKRTHLISPYPNI